MASGIESVYEIFNIIFFVLKWFWWLILLLVLVGVKFKNKNWPIEAIIIEQRGSNLIKTYDRAGKYQDPYTGIIGYRLQKAKDTLPVVNYDWVLHCNPANNSVFDRLLNFLRPTGGTIFLYRYGSKQYKPIKVTRNGNEEVEYKEIRDEKGEPLYIQIYKQFDPRNKLGNIDFEVVDWDNMNFMVQEQRTSAERRRKSGEWLKTIAIPLIMIGAAVIICLIMIKYGYDFAVDLKGSSIQNTNNQNQIAEKPNIPLINNVIPE